MKSKPIQEIETVENGQGRDEREARAARCRDLMQAALEETRCQLVAVPQFTQEGRVIAVIQIVATDR